MSWDVNCITPRSIARVGSAMINPQGVEVAEQLQVGNSRKLDVFKELGVIVENFKSAISGGTLVFLHATTEVALKARIRELTFGCHTVESKHVALSSHSYQAASGD